ncbi:MAG: hypothetical protein GY913_31485 [Proteobacteria bacterium]|nr:hypothetical protein [Pseudomonadota bacterium]
MPAVSLGLVWAAIYKGFGYGAHGSGMYLDPLADPGAYLVAGVVRAPMLVAGQILGAPVDVAVLFPDLELPSVVLGVVACGVLVWAARRGSPAVRWLAAGGALALIPVLATAPINRLLVVASVGMFPALAVLLDEGWREKRWGLVALVAVPHVLVSGLSWFVVTGGSLMFAQGYADVGEEISERLVPGEYVVVGVSDPGLAVYLPIERLYLREPFPSAFVHSDLTVSDHRITRVDEDALRVEILDGRMGAHPFEKLFRNFATAPIEVGHTEVAGPVEVRAAGGDADGIHTVEVTLDFDRVGVCVWSTDGFEVVELAVGEERVVTYAPGPIGI